MTRASTALLAAFFILGLVVGAAVEYSFTPVRIVPGEKETVFIDVIPLDGKKVKIGNIVSEDVNLERETLFIKEIIISDLNAYATLLGYDVSFDILVENVQSHGTTHLDKIKELKAKGVNLVIGGRSDSQARAALSYVNENDMLLFSPSSTDPALAFEGDNLFRMFPGDLAQAPAIAEMVWAWGLEAIVVIQRADSWADGIYDLFTPLFEEKGGIILKRIRYETESVNFSEYLAEADEAIAEAIEYYGREHVGVELLSLTEAAAIVTEAEKFQALWSVQWMGSDGTANSYQLLRDAPQQLEHVNIMNTYAAPGYSDKFSDLAERYLEATGHTLGFYDACTYDIAWAIAKAVLECQSTDALDVIPLLPAICDNQWGASGWTRITPAGDRASTNYDIWGYGLVGDGEYDFIRYGIYDKETKSVLWLSNGYSTLGIEVPGVKPPGH